MKSIFLLIFLLLNASYSFGNNVKNYGKNFNGAFTENIINDYMKSNGARIINAEVGRNGIDGLFYKKINGKMQVFVIESKYNTSTLNKTQKHGSQMSKEWKIGKIDEKILQLRKQLKKADKYEIKKIKKEIKLLKEAKRIVSANKDKSLLFKLKPIENKKYQLSLYELDKNGKIINEAKKYGINNKIIDLNKRSIKYKRIQVTKTNITFY